MRLRLAAVAAVVVALLSGCAHTQLSDAELSDPGIKARLEERLKAERGLDLRFVTLDVHDHVVTLSGIAASWDQRLQMERIARRLAGVDQVMVNLVTQE